MKQLSLDIDPLNNNLRKISKRLRSLGLKPIHELNKTLDETWIRF